MKLFSMIILTTWCCVPVCAQRHVVFSENIRSLQVVAENRWMELPVIRMDGKERVKVSFDELSHEYHRLAYSLTHLESDFTESQGVFTNDVIDGITDALTIEDYEESVNTIHLYTHYSLSLPNENCSFKMSGNYRMDIRDDDDGEILASVFFMVNENKVPISCSYSGNTDIDIRKSHQQVDASLDYSALRATDPRTQIKGWVVQNLRWDNARRLPDPVRMNQRMLEWTHCKDLIFPAGNEYHKFEILDVTRASMNVENNAWDGKEWHTILWPDYSRPSYTYDETPKGAFFIRNTDNRANDTESEYVNVHFFLKTEKEFDYPLYLNGVWTNGRFDDAYQMRYDAGKGMYEGMVPMKYGYYSYQYLMRDEGRGESLIPPTEGSYFETQNKYNVLVYYRGQNDRADRLVGYR